MKLAYIWIEEYKSINKLGVNLLPNYKFHFDSNTNKLIMENNDKFYLDELTNIRAILAKNGGGKTTILNAIQLVFANHNIGNWLDYFGQTPIKSFAIFIDAKENISICGNYLSSSLTYNNKKIEKTDFSNIFCLNYNFLLELASPHRHNSRFLPNDSDKFKYLESYPPKSNGYINIRDLDKDIFYSLMASEYITNTNSYDNFNFFKPDKLVIGYKSISTSLQIDKFQETILNKFPNIEKIYKEITETIIKDINLKQSRPNYKAFINTYFNFIIKMKIFKMINAVYSNDPKTNISEESNILEILDNTNNYLKKQQNNNSFEKIKAINGIFDKLNYEEDSNNFDKFSHDLDVIDIFLKQIESYLKNEDIEIKLNYNNIELHIPTSKKYSKSFEYLHNRQGVIEIDFLESKSGKTLNKLSNGEKQLITICYLIKDRIRTQRNYNQDVNIILLLDEIDLGLHFSWQKHFVEYLVKYITQADEGIQIIFTTHSAITVTDLPNSHITSLINGEIHKMDYNTFGGNIIELLKESFAQEGFVGNIAKRYIEEIKQFCLSTISDLYQEKEVNIVSVKNKIIQYNEIIDNIGSKLTQNDLRSHMTVLEQLIRVKNDQN